MLSSDEFEKKVKDLVKSYFPDAKWYDPLDIDDSVIAVTSGEVKECIDAYQFYREFYAVDDIVIDQIVDAVKELRFFKEPKFIYWRYAGVGDYLNFQEDKKTYVARARFTLGY